MGRYSGVTFSWEEEPEVDWAARYQASLAPVPVGRRFVVLPSPEMANPWPERTPLRLVPGMAFGTGEHYTTASCLRAFEELPAPPVRVLDVGCGSGILAAAAVLSGCSPVVACDTDPIACAVASETARANRAEYSLFVGSADGIRGTFDCVFANILAETLVEILPALVARVAPGGTLIGSGISFEKGELVREAVAAQLLEVLDKRTDGQWWTFTWRKIGLCGCAPYEKQL